MTESDLTIKLKEAEELSFKNPLQALDLYYDIIDEDQDVESAVEVYIGIGKILTSQNEINGAMDAYTKARGLCEGLNDPGKMCIILNGIGILYRNMGRIKEAISYFNFAYEYADKAGSIRSKIVQLNNMGLLNEDLKRYDEAVIAFKRGLELSLEIDDPQAIIITSVNVAGILIKQKAWEEALTNIHRAETTALTSKINIYDAGITTAKGRIFTNKKEWVKAESALNKSITLSLELKDGLRTIDAYAARYDYFLEKKEFLKAELDLKQALSLLDTIEDLNLHQDIYEKAFKMYASQEKWQDAFNSHVQFHELTLSIINSDSRRQIDVMERKGLQNAHEQIKKISEIGREITAELNFRSLLNMMYPQINEVMDASIFGIGSFSEETGELIYDLFIEKGKEQAKIIHNVKEAKTLGSWCINHNKEVIIEDFLKEYVKYDISMSHVQNPGKKNDFPQSILYTPLKVGKEVVGIMTVQSYNRHAYSINDIKTFKALSLYIAVALNNARQADLIKKKNEALKQISEIDELTGVFTRRFFVQELKKMWEWSNRSQSAFAMMMIDIDHFKDVNDTHGHPAGDACLKFLTKLVASQLHRPNDILARYGGEEFIILLGSTEKAGALLLAEKIRETVELSSIIYEGVTFSVTISIGVLSLTPGKDPDITSHKSLSLLDGALYQSKKNGRNRVTLASTKINN